MYEIKEAIKGIKKACYELNYPVVSGNVSLYNETNGKSIFPTPVIGGVWGSSKISITLKVLMHLTIPIFTLLEKLLVTLGPLYSTKN